MGWAVGFDADLSRWRGYGVPAYCDQPGCRTKIDRGFAYSCCEDPLSDASCGGFYCSEHQGYAFDETTGEQKCPHTQPPSAPEHPEWLHHVLTDDSWADWRFANPIIIAKYQRAYTEAVRP